MTQIGSATSHGVTPVPVPRTLCSYPLLPTLIKVAKLGIIVLFSSLKAVGAVTVIPTFSPALAHFTHPGMLMVAEGTRSCQWVRDVDISLEECEQVAAFRHLRAQSKNPVNYQNLLDHSQRAPYLTGFELDPSPDEPFSNIQVVKVGHNPQIYTNYQNALKFLETRILKNGGFFNEPAETLLETIRDTHKIIMKKLPFETESLGAFRTQNVILTTSMNFSDLAKQLSLRGGTDKENRHLDSSYRKIRLHRSFDEALPYFSQAEIAVWKKLDLKTLPEEIAKEMAMFAEALKSRGEEMWKKGACAIETAAWVHQSIVNIHPFPDGNGRLARAWMNTILQLGGIRGVVFYDEDAYTEAIRMDQSTPGHFTQFLNEIIEWNARNGLEKLFPEEPARQPTIKTTALKGTRKSKLQREL